MSIYEYFLSKTDGYDSKTAITYFGKEITYGEMENHIIETAKVLSYIGVREKDRVLFLMPNIPETAYFMYGCSLLGAIADFVDPRPDSVDRTISAKKILSIFEFEKADYIVALDLCFFGIIMPCVDEFVSAGLKKCVIVSADCSLDGKAKRFYLKEQFDIKGIKKTFGGLRQGKQVKYAIESCCKGKEKYFESYTDLLKKSVNESVTSWIYHENEIVVIVHSSGTSGTKPKPISLTNDNMNIYVHQSFVSNMTMEVGDKVLHMLPYFAAFGIVDVAHVGFCHINNLIQITAFEPKFMGYWIKKHKPQTIIGAPAWYMLLKDDKCLCKENLSCLKMITYGGDSMAKEDEKSLNDFFMSHNCEHRITKGHGMSEICGCGTYAIGEYNELGSIGIPMAYSTYGIINPETLEPIRYDDEKDFIEGEMIVSSPMVFPGELDGIGYASFVTINGVRFIRTKDIARMDRNGLLYFLSRSDRTFTRYDGYKVKPYEIEEMICKSCDIKECCITPYFDEEKKGLMPRLTIVSEKDLSREEKKQYTRALIEKAFCNNVQVSSRQIPSRVSVVESLPMTVNGKINYKAMEGILDEDIRVDFVEDSISLGNIELH